jgi:shikimate dehydrogenase
VNATQAQRVALIGWPVEHSMSPAMHNAAFAALDLEWRYQLLPTEPGRVATAVAKLRAEGFRGANVTQPHKEAAMSNLDDLTETAKAIGAVNTIEVRGGRLIGHNTDADGFVAALLHARFRAGGVRAAVVGAGGGARAAVFGLLQNGAEEVWLLNRSAGRAEALAHDLDRCNGGPPRLRVLPLTVETLLESARAADLLIHTTPVGMWPHSGASIWPDAVPLPAHLVVFDLIYNPPETRLLRQARESGAQAIGGLEMLVQQGVLAFQIWTGQPAPVGVMREAAEHALAVRGA